MMSIININIIIVITIITITIIIIVAFIITKIIIIIIIIITIIVIVVSIVSIVIVIITTIIIIIIIIIITIIITISTSSALTSGRWGGDALAVFLPRGLLGWTRSSAVSLSCLAEDLCGSAREDIIALGYSPRA
jgi:hypothetical protein